MYNIIVLGAVKSTLETLNQLVDKECNVVGVLGHEPKNRSRISGWADLKSRAKELDLPYKGFKKINESKNFEWTQKKEPDIIFAVGFSQLLSEDWLDMPKLGCIGFHPTKLPKGRGRAPLAWITLEQSYGSATFFLMGKSADNGPIFVQEVFLIEESDDAGSVEQKIKEAIRDCLNSWLPELKEGIWNPKPQEETEASWYGKRGPTDGHIKWSNSAQYIDRLIKASSHPHPGAYSYFRDKKIRIWKSAIETNIPIKGVVGRILIVEKEKNYLIQCGNGLLWLKEVEVENESKLRVGSKLGYNIEDEIFKLKEELQKFKL